MLEGIEYEVKVTEMNTNIIQSKVFANVAVNWRFILLTCVNHVWRS